MELEYCDFDELSRLLEACGKEGLVSLCTPGQTQRARILAGDGVYHLYAEESSALTDEFAILFLFSPSARLLLWEDLVVDFDLGKNDKEEAVLRIQKEDERKDYVLQSLRRLDSRDNR